MRVSALIILWSWAFLAVIGLTLQSPENAEKISYLTSIGIFIYALSKLLLHFITYIWKIILRAPKNSFFIKEVVFPGWDFLVSGLFISAILVFAYEYPERMRVIEALPELKWSFDIEPIVGMPLFFAIPMSWVLKSTFLTIKSRIEDPQK